MATKTSLIINAVNEGKTLQKAIADVNPQATTAELKAFAQGMLGLTDYTYTSGALVERTDLDKTTGKPKSTASFWLGDTELTTDDGHKLWYDEYYNFRISELSTNENVTHENGRFKFKIEVRDVYTNGQGATPVTSAPITLRKMDSGIVEQRVGFYIDDDWQNHVFTVWIDCDFPDTLPNGSSAVQLFETEQPETKFTAYSAIRFSLKA